VLNVESSHQYPNRQTFYNEVQRVLKPGGYFCYTDICHSEGHPVLFGVEPYTVMRQMLASAGMREVAFVDISEEILAARRHCVERYTELLEKAPLHIWLVRRCIMNMIKTSYDEVDNKNTIYFSSCWQKIDNDDSKEE